jgi:hypothetical protein
MSKVVAITVERSKPLNRKLRELAIRCSAHQDLKLLKPLCKGAFEAVAPRSG